MSRHPHILRAAYGAAPPFTAVNFAAQSLFNNSTSVHLLRVWLYGTQQTVGLFLYTVLGRLTTHNVGNIVTVVTGEAAPPGVIDQQDLAALPTANFFTGGATNLGFDSGRPYPFAVLRPGWSFVGVLNVAGGANFGLSFWWDLVYPDELINPEIGDPSIDRRVRA